MRTPIEIYHSAFDEAVKKNDVQRASQIAWVAVKSKYRMQGDAWVARDSVDKDAVPFMEMITFDDGSKVRETADGYLVANPRVARTGVQVYDGWEVGRSDLDKVSVYRPEEEVFHVDAISSLAYKPVTSEHPDGFVDADNWRELAVGHLGGDVMRDGDFVRVPLIVMDSDTVKSIRDNKREQLSVGYTAKLVWGDGVSPKGEKYNAIQKEIRANHVAITHVARGGSKLRMGDRSTKERTMATRNFVVDGITVEMEERDMQVIERHIGALSKNLETAQSTLETLRGTSQAELATSKTETANALSMVQNKDAEIVTLKTQLEESKLSPQALDKLVTDRVATVSRAKAIIGDVLIVDGKTDADMRRQVVFAKLGDQAKDWNDDMIKASFNTLTTTVTDGGNNLSHAATLINLNNNNSGDPRIAAYKNYDETISNRWKGTGASQ